MSMFPGRGNRAMFNITNIRFEGDTKGFDLRIIIDDLSGVDAEALEKRWLRTRDFLHRWFEGTFSCGESDLTIEPPSLPDSPPETRVAGHLL